MLGTILWVIVVVLVVIWLLGWLAFHIASPSFISSSLWQSSSCCITCLLEDVVVACRSVLSRSRAIITITDAECGCGPEASKRGICVYTIDRVVRREALSASSN